MLKRSKLLAPSLDGGIGRLRLLRLVDGGQSICLLAAPTGFGKSTLAANWLGRCQGARCWLSLDTADRDGPLLWANLIECLRQQRPEFGTFAQSLLRQIPLALDGMVDSLIAELAQWRADPCAAPLHWVIDDLHCLEDGPNLAALLQLLPAIAGWGRVVLSSRSINFLAGQNALALANVNLIDQHQLAFDAADVQALATQLGLTLAEPVCRTLLARTEGWVTAILLILRQMRNDGVSGRWNDAWLDGQMFTLAPLIRAHAEGQPISTRVLLSLLALAPQFDRALVIALAQRVEGTGNGLDAIGADTFVIRLQQPGWWKIHDLYRAWLQEQFSALPATLQQQAVDVMAEWLCGQGSHAQALALQAGHSAPEHVHAFLLRHYRYWLQQGLHDLLEQAAALLGDAAAQADPRLCLPYLWARADRLALADCRVRVERALAQAAAAESPADLVSELYSLLSYCEQVKGDPAQALDHARAALRWSEQAAQPLRSRPLLTIGLLTYMQGHMGEASAALAQALVAAQQERHHFHVILTLGYWMSALHLAGQFDEALAICARTRQWLQEFPHDGAADLWLDLPALDILITRGELDDARRRLQPLLRFADHAASSLRTALIYFCAVRVHYFHGDLHTSLEYLSRVEAAQARLSLNWNWGWAPVQAWRRRIALRQNRRQELEQWFDQHPVDPAADIPFASVEECLLDAAVLAQLGRFEQAESLATAIAHRAEQQQRVVHRLQALIVLGNATWQRDAQAPNPAAVQAQMLADSLGAHCLLRSEALWSQQPTAAPTDAPAPAEIPLPALQISKRERAVLALLAQGKSNSDIAAALNISTHTAKTHMKNILRKLDARNRTEALISARALGML